MEARVESIVQLVLNYITTFDVGETTTTGNINN
ncbi:hypothetical protein LMIV_0040 [Listeria monocytogenes FSL J1-208]|nr:hypothetical protein LMIV_0040 [Listeria monocytogenes FSL J1-208]